MVNPDGVVADTRKNCVPNVGMFIDSIGVNLNRNYGYDWHYYKFFPRKFSFLFDIMPWSPNYRGPHAFSENETQAVKNFVESQNIGISLSYHSYSEVIFYPWMHTKTYTPDEDLFVSIGKNISKINEYELITGSKPSKIRLLNYGGTLGTSENWLYGERDILAFTVELCNSTYAPTDLDIVSDICLKHIGVNLYVCERVQSL